MGNLLNGISNDVTARRKYKIGQVADVYQRKTIADFFLYPDHTVTPNIIGNLDLLDLVKLAATNKQISENIFHLSYSMKKMRKCIDFTKFPCILASKELEIIQLVFPNASRVIMGKSPGKNDSDLFDHLKKFYSIREMEILKKSSDSFFRSFIYATKLENLSTFDFFYSVPLSHIVNNFPAVKEVNIISGHLSKYSLANINMKKLKYLRVGIDVTVLNEDYSLFETVLSPYQLLGF